MSWKLQDALSLCAQGCDHKCREIFNQMYDAMILIQVNQVQGHQYPKRMHAPRRHQPYAFVVPKLQPPNKSPQARKNSICSRDRKAQEGFSGLIVHAIFLSLHSSRLWRVLTGPALTTALLIPCNP